MEKLVHVLTIGVRPKFLQRFYRRHSTVLGTLWLVAMVCDLIAIFHYVRLQKEAHEAAVIRQQV